MYKFKTSKQLIEQSTRLYSLLRELTFNRLREADPTTEGIELLAHNWGNAEAKKVLEWADKRSRTIFAAYEGCARKTFAYEHPEHEFSKRWFAEHPKEEPGGKYVIGPGH